MQETDVGRLDFMLVMVREDLGTQYQSSLLCVCCLAQHGGDWQLSMRLKKYAPSKNTPVKQQEDFASQLHFKRCDHNPRVNRLRVIEQGSATRAVNPQL